MAKRRPRAGIAILFQKTLAQAIRAIVKFGLFRRGDKRRMIFL
jgi:hypothetical protein